uniref:EGF-like domain-containing protein n=1 Tax=Angiostrongylus cantonensis TaxID=6313 RepID=A0A0K0CV87_ANGCA
LYASGLSQRLITSAVAAHPRNIRQMIERGECVCTLRYEGKQCEQERCLNGGRRHAVNGKVRCHCPFGLTGERCEKVTYCEPDKGKLVNGKCECNAKWTGLFCQMRTCYNGIPSSGMDGFCLCDVGFTGPFCDVPLICENGGKVTQENECSCPLGYTGERCEDCSIGHVREKDRCIPEVSESSLMSNAGSLTSQTFSWPIIIIGCVAAIIVILFISIVAVAIQRWSSKTSRESSVRGQPDATDV